MASIDTIEIGQEIDNRLEQHCSYIPCDLFNLELRFRYVSSLNLETTLETFNQSLMYRRDMLLSEEYGPNMVLSMFASTGASLQVIQTVIVPDILSFAREIDSDPVNLGRKIIKLILEVVVKVTDNEVGQEVTGSEIDQEVITDDEIDQELTDDEVDHELTDDEVDQQLIDDEFDQMVTDDEVDQELIDDEVDQAIDESLSTLNFKPASNSSIQGLKKFKLGDEGRLPFKKRRLLDGLSSKNECMICFDEFSDDDKVASMPCGHVYHDDCIVKWLETSHLCPLCRYQMPS
ncbi:E3 ubiquitin ligase BIG BROTHER-related-like [Durio zibethinus]|uniref:RING-type E3 ubiquitin transferase n=1 Tax=Durio zibethinus TaxID=66656 RepID=A0A6P6AN92_DURZI|nr:E3 ubiquitin ligase BIG BROTHER-related-like [Durio zibethinus]